MNAKKAKKLRKTVLFLSKKSENVAPNRLVVKHTGVFDPETNAPIYSGIAINDPNSIRGVYQNLKKQILAEAHKT